MRCSSRMLFFARILFTVGIISSVVHSQVKIREKISIAPFLSSQKTASAGTISPLFEIDSTFYGPPLYLANVIGEIDGNVDVTFTFSTTVSGTQPAGSRYWLQELPPSALSPIHFTTSLPAGGSGTFSGSFTRYPSLMGFFFNVQVAGWLFPTTVSLNATGDTMIFLYEYDLLPDYVSLSGRIVLTARRVSSGMDHFAVRLEKDTIAFTETSKIFVQAKDADSTDIDLAGNTILRFSIDSTRYGSFIKANGDTVPSPLANVLYSDAKDGNIRFAAVNKNPDSVVSFKVIAQLKDDTTKTGDTTMVLLEQTLKIVMVGERAVEPVIPPTVVNTPRAENRKQFTVRLTRGGKPVPDHPFRLTTDYIDGTGGHDHVTPRRTVSRENYGHFILRRTNAHHDRPYDGQTQVDGREELDYVASMFGDRMRLRVESTEKPLLWDTVSVVERVPGLVLLPEGTNYNKIGGTCAHHGPGGPTGCTTPDNNHYAAQLVRDSLPFMANKWVDSLGQDALSINDISLPYGGLFDVGGHWVPEHSEHREGLDVDVRTARPGRSGVEVRNAAGTWKGNTAFENLAKAYGVKKLDGHKKGTDEEHYHLDY
ncbi:MAG: hypothetical protein HW374_268 [Bacteroidetes bacterium]|nr:hypothetical protein [Bacteroidota bacterium]